jgi:predicted Zn-dependent protease
MYRRRKRKKSGWFHKISLIRLLADKIWFRLAFMGVVLLLVFLGLFLPKIWRVSPSGVKPVIKISGLDCVQGWSLKRSARKETAAGRQNHALFAWRAAVEHNPADIAAVRGLLESLLMEPPAQNQLNLAVKYSVWLLQLTGTNQPSLELVARVGDHLELYTWVVELLGPRGNQLGPELESYYLKALFHTHQIQRFATRWSKAGQTVQSNPEMALYQAAYLLGWGSASSRSEARQQLQMAIEDAKTKPVASRLMMMAAVNLGEVALYERAFLGLTEDHRATLSDHVTLWRLLARAGRRSEAIERAQAFIDDPTSASDVLALAEGYAALGLRSRTKQLLQRYATTFSQAEGIWVAYANLLIDGQSWEELYALSLQIRNSPGARDSLIGYSYYLEGRSEFARGKREPAETAFKRAAESIYDNRLVGLATASGLLQLGYPALGLKLLESWRQDQAKNPEYWHLLCLAAYQLKQSDLLLDAARTAYQLAPEDWNAINNYAAALLINRQRPDEVIRLTFQLIARSPDSLVAKVNHSLALARIGRAEESAAILKTIVPDRLSEVEAASYSMVCFETFMNLKQWDLARQADARITSRHLFPIQIDWWMEERQKLSETGPAARTP